jgi:hypothetical protein
MFCSTQSDHRVVFRLFDGLSVGMEFVVFVANLSLDSHVDEFLVLVEQLPVIIGRPWVVGDDGNKSHLPLSQTCRSVNQLIQDKSE